ncbi:MAG: hypothetical protein QOJ11_4210 [Frankiales bacterium]|jgi:hypothetical protein|nr:hypothetical protein [Frankiales bacterium]
MRYSRIALVVSVLAGSLAVDSAAVARPADDLHGNGDVHHKVWTLSSQALPIGLFGGIGLKLDNHRVMWIGAETENPADNNRTFIYDVGTRTIRETAPVPAAKPLNGLIGAGVLRDGSVVVAGGDVTDPTTGAPNPASLLSYRYDPHSNRWSRTGDLPEAQEWFFTPSTRLRDGRLLVAGGRGRPELTTGNTSHHAFVYDAHRASVVDVVDPQTGAPTGKKAVVAGKWDYTRTADGKVSDLSGGHLFGNLVRLQDGRVLVAGGHSFWAFGEEGNGPVPGFATDVSVLATDTQFFDPATGIWSAGMPLPTIPGEDDAVTGSHGGRANGVCLAALRDNTVVIAGGLTHSDGEAPFDHRLTRSSIVVMTPGRDPRNTTYQISPNAIPSGAGSGGLFGDGGRFQLPCYVLSTGKVMIAGGQNSAGEDLYDAYLFNARTFGLTRAPDLAHGPALWTPAAGYPAGFQFSAISTREVGMRDSRLVFPRDVLVLGGGYDPLSLDPAGTRRIEQFGALREWDD